MLNNLFGQSREVHYILELDFSADNTDAPHEGYEAAYLINTSNDILALAAWGSFGSNPWPWVCYVERYYAIDEYLPLRYGSFADVVLDIKTYNEPFTGQTYVLQPGEKVRLFSYAFRLNERNEYPYSYIDGTVYVNRQERRIRAYFNPELY